VASSKDIERMDALSETPRVSFLPASRVRYVVLTWLCLAAFLAYVPRQFIGPAATTIRSDLKLEDIAVLGVVLTPDDQMGQIMGAFFLTYALVQLPAGWLAHVWGTRRSLTLFAVLWSVASGLGALAEGYVWLMVTRLAMGAAQAGLFTCATLSVARWFPVTQRAVVSGALGSFMSIGAAVAAVLTGFLLRQEMSWRGMLLLYSLPGLLWAAGFFMSFRDRPEEHRRVNDGELDLLRASVPEGETAAQDHRREPVPWWRLLTSAPMWWICGQQFFRAAGYMFYASWFATYLQKTREVPEWLSGVLSGLPLAGVVAGSLVGGKVSDEIVTRMGSRNLGRKGLAILTQSVCALLIVLAFPIVDPVAAVLVISAGSFCAAVGAPCAYAVTIDMGGKHVATVFSLMNMAGNVGAFVFPVVVPILVRWIGWHEVLFVFAGTYAGAALCWAAVNPNGTIV
jgi:MFS family permease